MILNKKNMRNKKVILILCLLVLVSGSVQAQRLKAVQNEKGRYGFMTEDGTVVIKYKYDEATPFKDGIAKIGKDGKYSLINEDGTNTLQMRSNALQIRSDALQCAPMRSIINYLRTVQSCPFNFFVKNS